MIIIKILYGLIFIGAGVAILRYRMLVKSWTGNFFWAEHYLGRGGTHLIIILIALGFIYFGISYPMGGFDSFFDKK